MPRLETEPQFDHVGFAPRVGILLTNIGTPDAPTASGLRRYLARFLADRRVIDYPRWLWLPILYGIILLVRPPRSARLYQNVWQPDGSPLLTIMQKQAAGIAARVQQRTGQSLPVVIGMAYGNPSISSALAELKALGVRRVLVAPLFPQYSATTVAASLDVVFAALRREPWLPEIRTVNHYHDHPGYIAALVRSIREQWAATGKPDRTIFSYHGIPARYFRNGDPYYCECQKTTRLVAEQLGLDAHEYHVTFQSRFGPEPWLQPYTDETLEALGAAGLQHVNVVCPGFSADCLETLDEMGREGRHSFEHSGGGQFHYIAALNDRPDHLDALTDVVLQQLGGWLEDVHPAVNVAAFDAVHKQSTNGGTAQKEITQ